MKYLFFLLLIVLASCSNKRHVSYTVHPSYGMDSDVVYIVCLDSAYKKGMSVKIDAADAPSHEKYYTIIERVH